MLLLIAVLLSVLGGSLISVTWLLSLLFNPFFSNSLLREHLESSVLQDLLSLTVSR